MKICIDPGHGGNDPGAIGAGVYEKNIVLDVCKYMKSILISNGIQVTMTRDVDKTQSVTEKARIGNNSGADYFISVHCNAATNTSAKGTEVLVYNSETNINNFAQTVLNNILELGFTNRGIKIRPELVVLNSTSMPAMLIELAFITNTNDRNVLVNKKLEIATKICDGILDYLGIKKPVINTPVKIEEEEEEMVVYKTLNEVPAWGKESVQKAINAGILAGEGNGILNLDEISLKTVCFMDRMNLFDIDYNKLKELLKK